MRVLMLSQFYPPFIGGEAIHVRSLSRELVTRGHDVAVVTLWRQGLAALEVDQGVRVYRVHSSTRRMRWLFSNVGRRRAPTFPDPEITLALRRIIRHEQPEIVHAHNWFVYSFLPLKAWSGARLVVTLHNYNLVCANTALLYHGAPCQGPGFIKCLGCACQFYGLAKGPAILLSNQVMSLIERGLIDMFLAVSQAVAVGNGLVGSQLPYQVIPNFIPNDDSMQKDDCEAYLAQLPTENYLLFVGALGHIKGVDVLLHAYAHLSHPPPLVLIGYETPAWSKLPVDYPDNVFVLKNWPRSAVMEAWRRSIIALVPSVWSEPCPTVAMEAMSAGCPVIASRIGGLVDLVTDGKTGLLVQPADPLALQQAIERLLEDPDLRKNMGQAALRKVVEFQARTVVPRIEHVYQEVFREKADSSSVEQIVKAKNRCI